MSETGEVGASSSPTVSIVVTAFESADLVAASVAELLRQDFADYEIVLVDDGSTDGTAEVAAEEARRSDRLRVVALPENVGVARARQRGVIESTGEFVWFVDIDDSRPVGALSALVGEARRSSADVVIGRARVIASSSTRSIPSPPFHQPVSGRTALHHLMTGGITGHLWNKLFTRESLLGIRFTPSRVHSDLAMVTQLIARARRVAAVDELVYEYLLRSGSIIRSGSKRSESLAMVEQTVADTVAGVDPRLIDSPSFRYFLLRYILLSAVKDLLVGPYTEAERAALLPVIRRRIGWRAITVAVARRDAKRVLLATTAKLSAPLHLVVLGAAAERVDG